MKRDLYAEVTARIVNELERGAAPWIKPWSATAGQNVPCNAISNRPYSGCNVILLWIAQKAGWRTPRFVTFRQAVELGGHVRKGEHGTRVYFVKQLTVHEDDGEESKARMVPMLREYTVFNVDQCEGLPARVMTAGSVKVRNPDERDATIDEFLSCSGADIREGNGEAYFVPSKDFISMPAFDAFKSAAHFYGVTFHELGHWTGHKSRLDRDLKGRFGERPLFHAFSGFASARFMRVSVSGFCRPFFHAMLEELIPVSVSALIGGSETGSAGPVTERPSTRVLCPSISYRSDRHGARLHDRVPSPRLRAFLEGWQNGLGRGLVRQNERGARRCPSRRSHLYELP
jgi:antirestriction protein ArdC